MSLLNLLFFRPGGADIDQLAAATRRRLRRDAGKLTEEEDQVRRKLGLVYAPRLSLVDEESAALLRASDRRRLLAELDQSQAHSRGGARPGTASRS